MEKVGITAVDATKLALQFTQSLDLQTSKSNKKSLKEILFDPIQTFEFIKEKIKDARECIIEVGLFEDGESMGLCPEEVVKITTQIEMAANELNADATIISSTDKTHVLVRMRPTPSQEFIELRICVAGNVDAGKSTLLGVLTKNVLDDGRGKARVNLFRYKHELESGRTSSVGMELMGFDSKGEVIKPDGKKKLDQEDICRSASKVVTFLDLAGHEKYLKTTVFGMTGCSPDFVMIMIGANAGIIGMTKEHLGLAIALQIDMCPANVLETTISQLQKLLKSSGCRKVPMFINNLDDVLITSGKFVSERVCPIFQISNVTGQGLDLLTLFINLLDTDSLKKYDKDAPSEYQITDTFSVPGVGTVVSGAVHIGDTLLLGPDRLGNFVPIQIKSIHRKRVAVPCSFAGQGCCFALKKVKRAALRKGMVLVTKSINPKATMEFDAEVLILFHSTTIKENYQAMVHCGGVRQTAKIVNMDKSILRTGDRAVVRFRFMQYPEYIKLGSKVLFREGRTKGLGKIVGL